MTAKKKTAKKKTAAVGRPAFASNLVGPGAGAASPTMIQTRVLTKSGSQTIALVRSTPVDVSRLRATPSPSTIRRTK